MLSASRGGLSESAMKMVVTLLKNFSGMQDWGLRQAALAGRFSEDQSTAFVEQALRHLVTGGAFQREEEGRGNEHGIIQTENGRITTGPDRVTHKASGGTGRRIQDPLTEASGIDSNVSVD